MIARFLGDCPRLRSEGRAFEVVVEHLSEPDDRPLEKQVVSAVRRALDAEASGDMLVFLPGAAEIRRAEQALAGLVRERELAVLPLHGDLPLAEQARALEPASRRKVVLSTNVAESSLTIEHPWVAAFGFGLLHGLGFASGLGTLGLPPEEIVLALLLFNVGVELGQIGFVALYLAMERSIQTLEFSPPRWADAVPEYVVGTLGAYWTIAQTVALMGAR